MKRSVIIISIIFICFVLFIMAKGKDEYIEYYDSKISVVMKIASNSHVGSNGTFYICKLVQINGNEVNFKTRVRIKIKDDPGNYKYGDIIACELNLKEPEISRNPGNFDYKRYLLSLNVSAVTSVNDSDVLINGCEPDNLFVQTGITINKTIVGYLRKLLPDNNSQLIEAVLLGNKEYLDDDIVKLFSNAGISHFMSVSGAHAVFFLMPFSMVLIKINIKKQYRYILEIVLLFIFMTITGLGISVIRAVIMMSLKRMAFILKRDNDTLVSLFISLFVIILMNPYVVYSSGMHLSFGAVLSMQLLNPAIKKYVEKYKFSYYLSDNIKNSICICLSVQIGILPVIINNFKMQSIFAIVSNIICAPIIELLMISGMVMIFFEAINITFFAKILSYIVFFIGKMLEIIAGFISEFGKLSIINIMYVPIICILIYYIGILCVLYCKKIKHIKVMILLICLSILINGISLPSSVLEITCIDVGQGESIFFKTPTGKKYLIDCGSNDIQKVAEYRILPFLKTKNTNNLECLILTHPDNDHISGLKALLEEIKINYIIVPDTTIRDSTYNDMVSIIEEYNTEIKYISKDDYIQDGDVLIKCIYPYPGISTTNVNSLSVVLQLEYKDFRALFTGDIDENCENIINEYLEDCDVLKVAHHGSKYSTKTEFLDKIKPEIALISCSINNIYGHPHDEVLERLNDYSCNVYSTMKSGAITIRTNGKDIQVNEFVLN